MGSGESTTRKVSFGVDDEDRVRILRGVKLSEDVLQRMRGVANISSEGKSPPSSDSPKDQGAPRIDRPSPPPQRPRPTPQPDTSKSDSYAEEEQKRHEKKQRILREQMAKAQREREAALQEMTNSISRERQKRQDAEKSKLLAQQLQAKDAQLKALDAFYKEQLAQLEKRNWEEYDESKEKFHEAATKTESSVRARSTDPVCLGLQAQVFSCYRENKEQTLRCSDLAKEYMNCINAAKKNLLVNHG